MHTPNRGFTLIELLVVVAVISLLSSVVLASISDTRARARNSQRIQLLDQYRNSLELARGQSGDYPQVEGGGYSCLGVPSDGTCHGTLTQSAVVAAALSQHMTLMYPDPTNLASVDYDGFVYFNCPGRAACSRGVNRPTASGYAVVYVLENAGVSCGPGVPYIYQPLTNGTYCIYINQ
ncbi:MAG TPA: type II secretion system protein [Candidatus Paceibacterota bacterium]|jgi:prepilin-type N-terminal cleavage/methylation domain-containing protein